MDGDDKRLEHVNYARVLGLLALIACKTQAIDTDAAAPPPPVVDARVEAPPPKPTIFAEWERRSDPYKGMRIRVAEDEVALVTRSSVGNACQQSLWKPGDTVLSGGLIIVRDWGVVQGKCEHRDTKAPAKLSLSEDGATLTIAVTRAGKTTNQEWSRVTPAVDDRRP